jgi:hypothetical protein
VNYLDAILLAEARAAGRGVRAASVRHVHLTRKPMAVVLWQLGAEPFTVGAAAWGLSRTDMRFVAPGEPRDRELAFRALLQFANDFNPWFEQGEGQLVVANRGTLSLLARLGRRLAYLPLDGKTPADPALVRFGRHLKFIGEHACHPGQQVVVVLTELLRDHWAVELSQLEKENLAAFDAAIDPPEGLSVHEAVLAAEKVPVGPVPANDEDDALDPLVNAFNQARARSTDEKVVAPLRVPIEKHYRELIRRGAWPLVWKCLDRERELPEAPSAADRWEEDKMAIAAHLEWMARTGGITRVRDTHARAARRLRRWEEAVRLLEAHRAIDDPMKMLPYVLSHEALVGRVVSTDLEHAFVPDGGRRKLKLPRVTLSLKTRCLMPIGKRLYWTREPTHEFTLCSFARGPKGDWRVTLQLESIQWNAFPKVGDDAVFSIHHVNRDPPLRLPESPPWTHERPEKEDESIEEAADARGWE